MRIEVNPLDLLSPENHEIARNLAQAHNAPIEIYAFIVLNETLNDLRSKIEEKKDLDRQIVVHAKAEVTHPEETKDLDYNTRLEDLDLTGYCTGPLERRGVHTVAEVLSFTREELLKISRFGSKSFTELSDCLMDLGYIQADSDFGKWNERPVTTLAENTEDIEVIDEEEEEESYSADDFKDLSPTPDGIRLAFNYYRQAWDLDMEVARNQAAKIIKGVYNPKDESTFADTLEILRENMPMTTTQEKHILDLGKSLGEDDAHTRTARPEAMCGKPLSKLTYGEARNLIEEMEGEEGDTPEDIFGM